MRCALALVTAGATSAVLTACGESMETAPRVADSAARTASATTYRLAFDLRIDAVGDENDLRVSGAGSTDRVAGRSQMTYTLVGRERELAFEIRLIGDTLYQKYPPLIVRKEDWPAGKPWVRMGLVGAEIRFPASLLRSGPGSSTNALAILRSVGDAEEAGADNRRGVATTRYEGAIDVGEAIERVKSPATATELRTMRAAGVEMIPFDVWIDADGLIRAVHLDYDDMTVTDGVRGDVTVDLELFEFGAPVEVEAPPSGQITDFADIVGGSG